jgi:glycosyltransferase involved in cell wall biosynthesis
LKNILVNATALTSSGALTILKQFLNEASNSKCFFYVFVHPNLDLVYSKNIKLIEINRKSWIKRILWDFSGFKKHVKNLNVPYVGLISLQNTSVNIDVPQCIYLHQPIPFSNIKWNIFNKEQFVFNLYKIFYTYFIFKFCEEDTTFVVQTNWIKQALHNTYHVKSENIHVIQPTIDLPKVTGIIKVNAKKCFLYPATPIHYKNHITILEAMNLLQVAGRLDELQFQVTFGEGKSLAFDKAVKKFKLENNIEYLGVLSYSELISKYKAANFIVFPSFLETFGLPLAEAAGVGKYLICSDLPFAREVLNNYEGAKYVKHDDSELWASTIYEAHINNLTPQSFIFGYEQNTSWDDFFQLIDETYNV